MQGEDWFEGREPLLLALTEPMQGRARRRGIGLGLRVLMWMLSGVRIGRLEIELPNGTRRAFAGSEAGPTGVLQIRDGRGLVRRVLKDGEVGFGEAYLDGCWETPDLASLLAVMYINEPHYFGPYEKNFVGRFLGWVQHRRRANSRRQARRNIEAHYDLGNDFYRQWLDETMTYSSAVFAQPQQPLAEAQRHKYELLLQRLDLRAEHHLLEIGSGWGGFALYAAQRTGCRVTSVTLSAQQLAEARARAAAAGLGERVRFELQDYRDIVGRYDRIASIEMYEAVGEEYWSHYFGKLAELLKPGGRAALQGIVIDPQLFPVYRRKMDFIQKHVFPGGMLAPTALLMERARAAGLQPQDPQHFGLHYADTLAHWHRNVAAVSADIAARFGDRFLRLWRYYLGYCECGFRVRKIDLVHLTLLCTSS